jgi:hypothetical protein
MAAKKTRSAIPAPPKIAIDKKTIIAVTSHLKNEDIESVSIEDNIYNKI